MFKNLLPHPSKQVYFPELPLLPDMSSRRDYSVFPSVHLTHSHSTFSLTTVRAGFHMGQSRSEKLLMTLLDQGSMKSVQDCVSVSMSFDPFLELQSLNFQSSAKPLPIFLSLDQLELIAHCCSYNSVLYLSGQFSLLLYLDSGVLFA